MIDHYGHALGKPCNSACHDKPRLPHRIKLRAAAFPLEGKGIHDVRGIGATVARAIRESA